MTEDTLQLRKQQLVRDAIYDAAIELFAVKGFDETTVEEVAQAAGVSRRSFFRYFASKDDLLAQNVVISDLYLPQRSPHVRRHSLLSKLCERRSCLSLNKPLRTRVRRQIIEISQRSASARQAHHSRMMDVEDTVAAAFAGRLKSASKDD